MALLLLLVLPLLLLAAKLDGAQAEMAAPASKDSCDRVYHDSSGVIQVGGALPNELCSFTIYPLPGPSPPESSGAEKRHTVIRLQFEYVDLGPEDSLGLYSNGLDGRRFLTITGQGSGVVNRVITSQSASVVLQLTAKGQDSGAGFRVYYRAVESSPIDVYLISAIIVTSILTCILCSCCCNSTLSMLTGDPGQQLAGEGAVVGGRHALSAREKALLPVASFDASEARFEQHPDCCICLSPFVRADRVTELPTCAHVFHTTCIETWFDVNASCPLCKRDVKKYAVEAAAAAAAGCGDEEGGEGGQGSGSMGSMRRTLRLAQRRLKRAFRRAMAADAPTEGWRRRRQQHQQQHQQRQQQEDMQWARGGTAGSVAVPRLAATLSLPVWMWGWSVPPAREAEEDEGELQVVFHEPPIVEGHATTPPPPPPAATGDAEDEETKMG